MFLLRLIIFILPPVMIANILKYTLLLLFTAFIVFVYWYLYGRPLIGIDDANIYFVYIKNFAEGNGFVYNVGGALTEGFTSILWVLIASVLYLCFDNFE